MFGLKMMVLGTLSVESLICGKSLYLISLNLIVVDTIRSLEVVCVGGTLVLKKLR